jgi:transposase InsO family protein
MSPSWRTCAALPATACSGGFNRSTHWSSDTYIATGEGWLYLTVVIDLFSRQVVGWPMKPHIKTELVADALRMAWFCRHPQ